MKNFFSFVLLFTCYFSFSQESATSFSQAKANKSGELVFVYNEVFGFTELKSGEVVGLLVDVMNEFESFVKVNHGIDLNHKFVFSEDDFPRFLNLVQAGQGGVFGLGNISITDERKKTFTFSPPFLENVSLLVTNKSVPTLRSEEELRNTLSSKTGFVVPKTTNYEGLIKLKDDMVPSLKIDYYVTAGEVIERVSQDADALAILDLNYYLEALNKRLSIKRQSIYDQRDDPFGIIMPLNNDWEPVVREFFTSGFLESNRYREIIAKHLGSSALGLLDSIRKG